MHIKLDIYIFINILSVAFYWFAYGGGGGEGAGGCHSLDCTVVGFTTTYAISAYCH